MEKTKDTRSNGIKVAIIALVLLLIVAVAGTLAYLTDKDEATNSFTLASLDITLTETNWNAENATSVAPMETIAKNPVVTNSNSDGVASTEDAYVRMKVEVPVAKVKSADSPTEPNNIVLFELGDDSGSSFTENLGTGWTRDESATEYYIGSAKTSDLTADGVTKVVYTYTYNDPLAGGYSTSPLFNSVRLVDIYDTPTTTAQNIVVTAQAIQTTSFADAAAAWAAYEQQNA